MTKHSLGLLVLGLTALTALRLEAGPRPALIPWPQSFAVQDGSFELSSRASVRAEGPGAAAIADWFLETLELQAGLRLSRETSSGKGTPGLIFRVSSPVDSSGGDAGEGYRMAIEPARILLEARSPAGLFYGAQTLNQLIEEGKSSSGPVGSVRIDALQIEDRPRFAWRGLMLDCSRTFQSLEYLRKTIDRLAAYKMNVLHLHLTDDQGWRVEIKRYPELTRKGARFPDRWGEPEENQGFYSQEELRGLVAYAASRHVTIVPEIEMPGHSLAVLSCYPELSCSGGPFEIFPFFKGPNITEDVLCPGNDATFEFLEGVLAEIADLFPSRFIHVGGDEAPKVRWEHCPKCRARMRSEGLETVEELQGYFLRRVEQMVERHGRRVIGWTEIVDGGLGERAAVMSWLGMRGAERASEAGHDVVMSPTTHCYFDYEYSRIDTRRAYSYEPVPEGFDPRRAAHILGLQANFWSHIDRTPNRVDRQLYPRLLAIAERGWSSADLREWESFKSRILPHLEKLAGDGVRLYPDPSLDSESPAR